MGMRRLGVYGENLATKTDRVITPSDFSIAGLYAMFNRKYKRSYRFRDSKEASIVLGPQTDPSVYGWDALNGFFGNLNGQAGSIYVASYPGVGAIQASYAHQTVLRFAAACQGEPEYGKAANRTGVTMTRGQAFFTNVRTASSGTTLALDSVTGIKVGDQLAIGATPTYKTVTDLNEASRSVTVDSTVTVAQGDGVAVVGYRIRAYLKGTTGLVSEVESTMGDAWVTFNPSDPDRYAPTYFKAHAYLDVSLTGTLPATPFTDLATVTYLSGGTDGTRPVNTAQYADVWPLLDNKPVRMVAAVETSDAGIQQALETYCVNRSDNPIAVLTGQENLLTKAQCVAAGQAFQRSNEVDAVYVHNWLGVADPFSTSPTAPRRFVPPGGHLMGLWIQSIGLDGIHCIPARKSLSLAGVSQVEGYAAESDFDRTDLADAGVNVVQAVAGRGILVRNFFTPSTAPEFRYANATLMRNFVKVSVVEALQESENQPNVIARVRQDRMAAIQFMHKLWLRGSTGGVPTGETFGQYERDDGSFSTEAEAYEVIADASNNPVAVLQAGNRNMDIYFMFPAPAGSIKIGVGLIYRVA